MIDRAFVCQSVVNSAYTFFYAAMAPYILPQVGIKQIAVMPISCAVHLCIADLARARGKDSFYFANALGQLRHDSIKMRTKRLRGAQFETSYAFANPD